MTLDLLMRMISSLKKSLETYGQPQFKLCKSDNAKIYIEIQLDEGRRIQFWETGTYVSYGGLKDVTISEIANIDEDTLYRLFGKAILIYKSY